MPQQLIPHPGGSNNVWGDELNAILGIDHEAIGNGSTANQEVAIAAAQATNTRLHFPAGVYRIDSNLTQSVDWSFAPGAQLTVADGVTLTLNGTKSDGTISEIQAGHWQIFDGWPVDAASSRLVDANDVARIQCANSCTVRPEWFGAVGDGTTNDKPAWQRLGYAAQACSATVVIECAPGATYLFDKGGLSDLITDSNGASRAEGARMDGIRSVLFKGNGATLKAAADSASSNGNYNFFVFAETTPQTPSLSPPMDTFTIEGPLTLDGNMTGNLAAFENTIRTGGSNTQSGAARWGGWRTLFYIFNYKRVVVRNVEIKNTILTGIDASNCSDTFFDNVTGRGGYPLQYDGTFVGAYTGVVTASSITAITASGSSWTPGAISYNSDSNARNTVTMTSGVCNGQTMTITTSQAAGVPNTATTVNFTTSFTGGPPGVGDTFRVDLGMGSQAFYVKHSGDYMGRCFANSLDFELGSHGLGVHVSSILAASGHTEATINGIRGKNVAEALLHVENAEKVFLHGFSCEILDSAYSSGNISDIFINLDCERPDSAVVECVISGGSLVNARLNVNTVSANIEAGTAPRVVITGVNLLKTLNLTFEPYIDANVATLFGCSAFGTLSTPINTTAITCRSGYGCSVRHATTGVLVTDVWDGIVSNCSAIGVLVTSGALVQSRVSGYINHCNRGVSLNTGLAKVFVDAYIENCEENCVDAAGASVGELVIGSRFVGRNFGTTAYTGADIPKRYALGGNNTTGVQSTKLKIESGATFISDGATLGAGTATSATSAGTLTDGTKSWPNSGLVGMQLNITTGAASGTSATITANNGTTLSISSSWVPTPAGGDSYTITPLTGAYTGWLYTNKTRDRIDIGQLNLTGITVAPTITGTATSAIHYEPARSTDIVSVTGDGQNVFGAETIHFAPTGAITATKLAGLPTYGRCTLIFDNANTTITCADTTAGQALRLQPDPTDTAATWTPGAGAKALLLLGGTYNVVQKTG